MRLDFHFYVPHPSCTGPFLWCLQSENDSGQCGTDRAEDYAFAPDFTVDEEQCGV